ncbi:unnamed protein product [Camellia sinensis]
MEQEHDSQIEIGLSSIEIGLSSRLHSLKESLDNLVDESFPDIYRVPKELRAGNEQYYTPTTISIGPLHAASDNPSLTDEVKLKKRALKLFLSDVREDVTLDFLIDLLKGIEGEARKCYNAEEIKVEYSTSDEFVEMMLLDGCFILALIYGGEDPVFMGRARGPLFYSIQQDLLLLENQLPFFVLEALWKATLPHHDHQHEHDRNLIQYAVRSFMFLLPGEIHGFSRYEEMEKPKHLLELVLFALFPLPPRKDHHAIKIYSILEDIPKNMSELALYGIKIKSNNRGDSLVDVKFRNGVLEIPALVIEESTTSLFKNLLALEQCQNQKRSSFTSYLFFLDALVDTDKDIDLLLQAGVLKTWLNDKQALVSLLSGLGTNLLFSIQDMVAFEDIFAGLKEYCSSHELHACLMRNYYASRWDILNSILIFIFTVTQAVFAVVSYNPRNPCIHSGIVQLPNSPTESSQMHNPKVLHTETNLLGSAMSIEDILSSCNSDSVVSSNSKTEELAVANSSVNGSAANVGDCEMQSSTMLLEQETDVKGSEESNRDEVLSDVAVTPSQTTSKDPKTSDSVTGDQIVESQEKQIHEFGPVMSLHNLTSEVKSCEHMEVLANTDHIESDSAQDRDVGSHGDSVDGYCIKGEENENAHFFSVANIPVVDHPEIMVEDFKDHKAVKLNFRVALDSGEVIEPVVDDNKDTFYEENSSSFVSNQSDQRVHLSSAELHVLEGDPKQEAGGNKVLVAEIPVVEGETDTSELNLSSEDLRPNGVEAPPETTISWEVQTDSHLEASRFSCNNAYDQEKDKTEICDTDVKESWEEVNVELSANIKTSSESVDDFSVYKVNQTTNFIGEKSAMEISDLVENGSRDMAVQEKPETNSRMTFESACNLSESEVVDAGMDKVMNLQETETTTYFVSDLGDDENSEETMKDPKFNKIPPEHLPAELGFSMKSSATVDDSHCRDDVLGVSGTSTEHLKEERDKNFTKQQIEGPAVDVSVDSSSQTDSLEAVLSTQSDAVAAINAQALPTTASKAPAQSEMQNPKTTSEGHHSNKSDVFEPPSFMTLVERGDRVDQNAASDDIQAGFPSFTNVDNQSQGRKKNEEIIAKVTNWSTGKQHIPLKSLLGEANLETKLKSPIPKQTVTVTKSNDGSATTVNSILGPEATTDQVAPQREMGKEWNSPARYRSDNKKEKRKVKGRSYWVPFVCCSSVN